MAGQAHFEIFPGGGEFRWRSQSANGVYDGHSDQGFESDRDAERAIYDHVKTVLVAAGIIDASEDPPEVRIERVEA